MKKDIRSDYESISSTIIGTYEGECADSNITNLNGLDITRDVWEAVFSSDDYKKAIEHGWYIGFLGHPEDPNCMDFRNACIVMTEGHIQDSGKVYGKFNLIDTPVGRVVKAFTDAGVKFGISVRGAGDIVDNSVDPDTFVFRGFDLVTFPAFPESIPEFKEIAASNDIESQKKYKKICSAVENNLKDIDSIQSIDIIQSCFAKQSDTYADLENRKMEIESCSQCDPDVEVDPRINSTVQLYLESVEACEALKRENQELRKQINYLKSSNDRRMKSMDRICSSQYSDMHKHIESITASMEHKDDEINRLRSKLRESDRNWSKKLSTVEASLDGVTSENSHLKNIVSKQKAENLKYRQKVEATLDLLDEKDKEISSLNDEIDETVRNQSKIEARASNFDDKIKSLTHKVTSAENLIRGYQDAYSKLYSTALGIRVPNLDISCSTSVDSLQDMIRGTSIAMKPSILQPTQDMVDSDFELGEYSEDDLVTL